MAIIKDVIKNSLADNANIKKGEDLLFINDVPFIDVLDLMFQSQNDYVKLDFADRSVTIENFDDEDLGLVFDTYLIDKEKNCHNKCIFCFVDQLPPKMRDTLSFKDDDYRLSFLFGNYVTLTNLSENDIDKICAYKVSPLNISVHTTDKDLREYMLHNKKAGNILNILKRFKKAKINMRAQLVIVQNVNDGKYLEKSLVDLYKFYPYLTSVSVVPVGITKFRENLAKVETITEQNANAIIDFTENFNNKCIKKHDVGFCYAADELYIKAKRAIPPYEYYDEFEQLENGVGLIAMFKKEFYAAIGDITAPSGKISLTLATSVSSYDFIKELLDYLAFSWHNLEYKLYKIYNNFFGQTVNVAGLITGEDLIDQLQGEKLYKDLLIPEVMLRFSKDLFLDDLKVSDVEKALDVKITTVPNNGEDFIHTIYNLAK
ncbi:MAG: DUF512 domain-containing protein [Clostridia bacterium]